MGELFDNNQGAEFSPCGKYRYKLWRIWDPLLPKSMCIGLNPSTANADTNDATIRNLIGILTKLGYGGFYMMNLFAWISSNPDDLITCSDPLGENENKLKEVEALCNDVIFCWGNFKQASYRRKVVAANYTNAKCFGFNKNGTPFHPRALTYIKGALAYPELFLYKSKEKILKKK